VKQQPQFTSGQADLDHRHPRDGPQRSDARAEARRVLVEDDVAGRGIDGDCVTPGIIAEQRVCVDADALLRCSWSSVAPEHGNLAIEEAVRRTASHRDRGAGVQQQRLVVVANDGMAAGHLQWASEHENPHLDLRGACTEGSDSF
jgi:hypothetical protein